MGIMTPQEKEAFKIKMKAARDLAKAKRDAEKNNTPDPKPAVAPLAKIEEEEPIKKCIISDEGATIAPTPKTAKSRAPVRSKSVPIPAEPKKKPYAKVVIYDDPCEKEVKFRIGKKKKQQLYYEPSDEESEEDEPEPVRQTDKRGSGNAKPQDAHRDRLRELYEDFFDD